MVPVSHAPDLKAVNSKTNAVQPNQAQSAPAKTGFQALIDHIARSSHAEREKQPAQTDLKAKTAVSAHEGVRDLKKVIAEKPEKPDKDKAAKPENRDADPSAGSVLIAATFVVKPDAPKPAEAALPKALRDRGSEVKPVAPNGDSAGAATPNPLKLQTAKHADRVEGEAPKVTFVDRRTDKEKEKDKAKADTAVTQAQNAQTALPAPEAAAKSDAVTGVAETKVVFHPTDQGTPFDVKPQNTPVAPRDAATFQQYLIDKGYNQMVEQARVVLKDNNAGEIRMTLHPESLGKVKVALNLSDGSLAGQIFVENQTVKDVFQANLDGLLQAFRDGGWNNLNLQVSVGGGNPQRQNPETPQARDYGRQVSSTASVSEAVPDTRIGAWTDRQVNLTA